MTYDTAYIVYKYNKYNTIHYIIISKHSNNWNVLLLIKYQKPFLYFEHLYYNRTVAMIQSIFVRFLFVFSLLYEPIFAGEEKRYCSEIMRLHVPFDSYCNNGNGSKTLPDFVSNCKIGYLKQIETYFNVNNITVDQCPMLRQDLIELHSWYSFYVDEYFDQTRNDWIDELITAWAGHRIFASWLVEYLRPKIIVELGVDKGYSAFVFANALQHLDDHRGVVYGIDLFSLDGFTSNSSYIRDNVVRHNVTNLELLVADFNSIVKVWTLPINILHIDGQHGYEDVRNDYQRWIPFLAEGGVVLFHDIAVPYFGVKDFFSELRVGYKLFFAQTNGLGVLTFNKNVYDVILATFENVYTADMLYLLQYNKYNRSPLYFLSPEI